MRFPYDLSFFNFVTLYFGSNVTKLLKLWICLNKDLIKISAQIRFLQACKKRGLTPRNLQYRFKDKVFHCEEFKRSYDVCTNKFIDKVLCLELSDAYTYRRSLHSKIYRISKDIDISLPAYLVCKFFNSQHNSLHKFNVLEGNRLENKLSWLIERQTRELKTKICTNNIQYFYSPSDNIQMVENTESSSFSFERSQQNVDLIEVSISPKFEMTSSNPLDLKDKWFVNLTNVNFPPDVQGLLQLGEGFCLLPDLKHEVTTIEFIKCLENNIKHLPPVNKAEIRNKMIPLIHKIKNTSAKRSQMDCDLLSALSSTKKFLHNNQQIILTRADKGNSVVAMDRADYIEKMRNLLNDSNTYSAIKRNPVNSILSNLKTFLKRWKSNEYISSEIHSFLNTSNAILPRAYGLPKIHKPGCPLRVIVSSVGSPLHNLAAYIHKIIYNSIPPSKSHIKNSFNLVDKIKNIHVDSDSELISLDVISLFTNIPVELAIVSIERRWELIGIKTSLPKVEFINIVKFLLDSAYFMFDGGFYKQTFGAPMGSPLSPVIADLVLQDLEISALNKLKFTPSFYFRYVDDIALTAPRSQFDEILNMFNSFHPRLQFTMEIGKGDRLNFLDVTLIKTNNLLTCDWFHKPTFSGRYLNFYSCHPICQKKGTILGLIDRAFFLSHPVFHRKNFELVIKILLDNGYPALFIFDTLKSRLKTNFKRFETKKKNKIVTTSVDSMSDEGIMYFTVPYVPGISEKVKPFISNNTKMHLSFTSLNKLSKLISVPKDKLPLMSRPNVVYRINCSHCEASYVGQTGRLLRTRIMEHRNQINRNMSNYSVVTHHRTDNEHDFDWDNVLILDEEKVYTKRLISEMIFIKKQTNGLNLQSDTDFLDAMYLPILNGLKKT